MALHAAVMLRFFVDQATQAPVVVQCSPNNGQDPLWARLLFAAIPSIFALGIAWMAFHWTKQKERDQWIRDQRKAEWRNLLDALTSIQEALPSAFSQQLLDLLSKNSSAPDKYLLAVAVFKRQMDSLLFVADATQTIKLSEKFNELVKVAKSMRITKDSTGNFETFVKSDLDSYHDQFNLLVNLIHRKAVDDLNS
jgi:hypothetical protein